MDERENVLARYERRTTQLETENARLRAVLVELLKRIDDMPNPHEHPMRAYYNQMMGGWMDPARDALEAPHA